jgi:hypothetical protein
LEREKRLAEEDLEHLILKDVSDILQLNIDVVSRCGP